MLSSKNSKQGQLFQSSGQAVAKSESDADEQAHLSDLSNGTSKQERTVEFNERSPNYKKDKQRFSIAKSLVGDQNSNPDHIPSNQSLKESPKNMNVRKSSEKLRPIQSLDIEQIDEESQKSDRRPSQIGRISAMKVKKSAVIFEKSMERIYKNEKQEDFSPDLRESIKIQPSKPKKFDLEDDNDALKFNRNRQHLDIPSQELPIRSSLSSGQNNDSSNRSDRKLVRQKKKNQKKARESVVRIQNQENKDDEQPVVAVEEEDIAMGVAVPSKEELHNQEMARQEIEKLAEPFWLINQFIDRPISVALCGFVIILLFTVVAVWARTWVPSPITIRDLLDYSDIRTLTFDTKKVAEGYVQANTNPNGMIDLQTVIDPNWQLVIGIETKEEGKETVMTPRGVKFMHEIDKIITADPTWQATCLLDSQTNRTCMDNPSPGYFTTKASILVIFKQLFGEELEDLTQFGIDFALFGLAKNVELFNHAIPLFSKEFNNQNRKAKMVRMLLTFAGPIHVNNVRYSHMSDRQEQQEYIVAEWQNQLGDKLLAMQREKFPDFRVHIFGRSFVYRSFYRQLMKDVLWSGLAGVVVFIYVSFHVKSIFVASTAMAQILFSFPITLFLYRICLNVNNVSSLHLMIVFVVLGISADNIFVIWDAWCQSESYEELQGNQRKRLAYTFRRAYKAILATSSTTAFAFLSNGFSSLMPISAFGYFAFVIVPVNYVLIVFYFPCYLVIYENYVKEYEKYYLARLNCFSYIQQIQKKTPGKPKIQDSKNQPQEDDIEMVETFEKPVKTIKQKTRKSTPQSQTSRGKRKGSTKIVVRKSYTEDDGYYEGGSKTKELACIKYGDDVDDSNINDSKSQHEFDQVQVRPSAEGLLQANKSAKSEVKENLDKFNSLELFFDSTWNNWVKKYRWPVLIIGILQASYASIRSTEIVGLSQMERYFPQDHPITGAFDVLIGGFNEGKQGQSIVVELMWGLEGIDKSKVDYYNASDLGEPVWKQDLDVIPLENQKALLEFCEFIKKQDYILLYEGSIDCWISNFRDFLKTKRQKYPIERSRSRSQEENFYYWLNRFVTESPDGQNHLAQTDIGIVDGKLKYFKFKARSGGEVFSPYAQKILWWQKWEDLVTDYNSQAPKGINSVIQTASMDWCIIIMELRLVETMQQGLGISIGFALLALLVATGNVIVASLASMTIGMIIVNVMAIVAYMKWELGAGESVGVVVCVGFAVDYVVHLASHYVHSKYKDRDNRIRECLRELGISILSGSLTTIGATVTLYICTLVMFNKFATFVVATIIFSISYSLGFFTALCHILGPQNEFGNVGHIYKTTKDILLCKFNMKDQA